MELQSRESKVEGASQSVLSGSHQFLSIFVIGAVSEACWGGLCDSSLIVNGSVAFWELEDGWIVCSKAVFTGVEHRNS